MGGAGAGQQPDQVTQNSRFDVALRREGNHTLWVENSVVPASWQLASQHVLTGVPENDWTLRLDPGVCLDFVPIGEDQFCVRAYGFGDTFPGPLGGDATRWLGQPAGEWFAARGLELEECCIDPQGRHSILPALSQSWVRAQIDPAFVEWLFAPAPQAGGARAARWRSLTRLSAQQLPEQVNVRRLYEQRARLRQDCLLPMLKNFRWSVFFRLDLEATARAFAACADGLPELRFGRDEDPMQLVHDQMFRSAVLRHRNAARLADLRGRGLRPAPRNDRPRSPALPGLAAAARSGRPDRLGAQPDPLRPGGRLDRYASLLHRARRQSAQRGRRPQRPAAHPGLCRDCPNARNWSCARLTSASKNACAPTTSWTPSASPTARSRWPRRPSRSPAFCRAFTAQGGFGSLEQQLREFGGGIELSLLSAVPKGSGLGTSSILAATVLAALGDLCGLDWDRNVLFTRTLALEQMLTTGGGWQDQAGAIFRGIKLIETAPGLAQKPAIRWLPHHLFDHEYANRSILLYYTGLTRLAKNILAEIVRGIFLNSPTHLGIIADIGANADLASAAIQKCDYDHAAGRHPQ